MAFTFSIHLTLENNFTNTHGFIIFYVLAEDISATKTTFLQYLEAKSPIEFSCKAEKLDQSQYNQFIFPSRALQCHWDRPACPGTLNNTRPSAYDSVAFVNEPSKAVALFPLEYMLRKRSYILFSFACSRRRLCALRIGTCRRFSGTGVQSCARLRSSRRVAMCLFSCKFLKCGLEGVVAWGEV